MPINSWITHKFGARTERLLLVDVALLALDLLGMALIPRQLGGLLLALVIWALATNIV